MVAKHTTVKKHINLDRTWYMHTIRNNITPRKGPQSITATRSSLSAEGKQYHLLQGRTRSSTLTYMGYISVRKLPPNSLSLLARVMRVSYHTAVAGVYLEVSSSSSAAVTHVRNDPHPRTQSPTHRLISAPTKQLNHMRYSCTIVHVEQRTLVVIRQ